MLKGFFKAFPPPKFLDISFAGLYISDRSIHCIQFGKKNGRIFIEKFTEADIPADVINSGVVNNKAELVGILQKMRQDLSLGYVKVSVPEERAYLFTARIPIVDKKEVQSVVESKIEGNVPVPPSELIFDFDLIDHRSQGHLDAIVSALPRSFAEGYVEVLKEAGLELLSLEIESQAAARALIPAGSLDTELIIHFRQNKFSFYVIGARVVRFTSTISVKSELSADHTYLLQEAKKLYIYWHTLKENAGRPEKKINKIILCGENFDQELVPYLSLHMQTPVSLGNVWQNAFDLKDYLPEISFNDSLRYAPAVGLALPSEILI